MAAPGFDPATAIALVALHLVGAGVLMLGLSWRLAEHRALRAWSLGALLFGLGFGGRLTGSLTEPPLHTLWVDLAMVGAQLCFVLGLRRHAGGLATARTVGLPLAAFALLHLPLSLLLGLQWRYAVLNGVMGVLYGVLAVLALRARTGHGPGLGLGRHPGPGMVATQTAAHGAPSGSTEGMRLSLAVLGAVFGLLALLTLARALRIAWQGTATLYSGPFAALYFAVGALLGLLLSLLVLWHVFEDLLQRLRQLASRDPLTGTLNRLGLDQALRQHFGARHRGALQLLAVDVDHFKRVNDQHGHAMGDAVLAAIARTLREGARGGDLVARLGGEEFVVAYQGSDAQGAWGLAERLRLTVADLHHQAPADAPLPPVTISIGLSPPMQRLADWDLAVAHADAALYAAKAAGRNRTQAAGAGQPPPHSPSPPPAPAAP